MVDITKFVLPTHENEDTKIWQIAPEDHDPFCLSKWLVHAPWMHIAWSYHFCGLIHLRDVAGEDNAKKHFEDATHEFHVVSVDPDYPPDLKAMRYLTPSSIAQQFIAKDDAEALQHIENCMVRGVMTGKVSLDSDYREHWKHILKDRCPVYLPR